MKTTLQLFAGVLWVFFILGSISIPLKGQTSEITFTLINAATNQPVPGYDPIPINAQTVRDATLNFRFLPPQLSIRANVPPQFESVSLVLQTESGIRLTSVVENFPPYALGGDNNGNYAPFAFTGIGGEFQRLFAVAWTQNGARGKAGASALINLFLVDEPGDFNFTLVNTNTNQDIEPINNGDIFFLFGLPSELNIRGDIFDGIEMAVESVRFNLSRGPNGSVPMVTVENFPPYAVFGDNNGNYAAGTLVDGDYTLTATAFSKNGARGDVVAVGSVDFLATSSRTENNDDISFYSYPNPFNGVTNLAFELPEADNVQLTVYNLIGRKMATLIDGWREAGPQTVMYDAGNSLEGVFYYKLRTKKGTFTGRMLHQN